MDFQINQNDLNSLRFAVRRNPRMVITETGKFLSRGIAAYLRIINRSPWRMGQRGGGSPVGTGNLRDTHRRSVGTWEARITPTADYAPYVHGLDSFPRRRTYQLRPWLNYAQQSASNEINRLQDDLLKNIISDLSK